MSDVGGPGGLPRGWRGPPPSGGTPTGAPPHIAQPPTSSALWAPTPPADQTAPALLDVAADRPAPGAPDRGAYDLQDGLVDIRPLGFTDILDGSFTLLRAGLRVMVPLVLVVMVPLQLLSAYLQREALSFGLTGALDDPAAAALVLGEGGLTPALALTLLTQLLLLPVLSGALVLVAGQRYLGRPVDLRSAVVGSARRAGPLVLAYVVSGLLRVVPLLPVALAAATGSTLGLALSIAFAVVAVVLLTPLFAVVIPAVVLEPGSAVQAFRHALQLTRRAYPRTAGVVVGTTLVFNLLALLLAGIPNVIGIIGGFGFAWVLVAVASTFSQLITAPLNASAMVLLHADLRIRQEGMDFDVLLGRVRATAAGA